MAAGLVAVLVIAAALSVATSIVLVRRAGRLNGLELSVLEDPSLDDSPLTQRDGKIISIPLSQSSTSSALPLSSLSSSSSSSPLSVSVRAVFVTAATARNPIPAKLPAFVLIHGLGGQLSQFDHLVDFFAYYADVLAIDLPGCGKSPFNAGLPDSTYGTDSLLRLIADTVVDVVGTDREIILVGHSLGAGMATFLAAPGSRLEPRCRALIAICPPAPLPRFTQRLQRWVVPLIPATVFDIFRYRDRQGGLHSPSVSRLLGEFDPDTADPQKEILVRRRQLRWNLQVRTPVWLAMASGARVPDEDDWQRINTRRVPVLVICGQADKVTPPELADCIQDWIGSTGSNHANVKTAVIPGAGHMCLVDRHHSVSGIINEFVVSHVDQRLSLAWQLADLATRDDKWSLKNEQKWRKVEPVSAVIDHSPFRAMKTLRQDDDHHNPVRLETEFVDITDVIDISRDQQPPYDPAGFKRIRYHKFPTVSKIPPTRHDVNEFIKLVDQILHDQGNQAIIAVHCHYGFNRTGFLICSYMIQRMGKPVRVAVADFKAARNPGIKHPHFIDELYLRYTL
ncbi:Alpha/Beta hydrolase protein [Lipomyces japonicus]|uniref:Alpha/Beta hydrolase protein n=1 Tax=Lipomyces japonicus TaxID=56871 RepID=UPI0034CF8591